MTEPKITPDARKLLATLVKKQDRAWFAAHKDEFSAKLTEPVRAVLSGIGPRVMKSFPDVENHEPKVYRIYRDVRFSKDKSPYKDHVAGELDLGPASVYFHVDSKDCFAAVGPWMMEPEQLKSFRAALAHTDLGPALAKETARLVKAGFEHTSIGQLSRAPAGIAPNHPCIELLRHKGWCVVLPKPALKNLVDGTLPAFLAKHLEKVKPALALVQKAMSFRP
jgi:uncharacterized protein (TIGR02453 family)